MTLALATVSLALLGLLAYREWVGARDREAAREERAAMATEQAEERLRHAAERKELYQRIQAPEIAVAEAHRERRGPYVRRKPIGADDDAAFMARKEVDGG